MRSNEPPERSPRDRVPRSTIGVGDQAGPLPPYSARWATGGRLAIAAIILLLAAAFFAKAASHASSRPDKGLSVQRDVHEKAPPIR